VYDELQKAKRINNSPLSEDGVEHVVDRQPLKSVSFFVDSKSDLKEIYDQLIMEQKIECSLEQFHSILRRENRNDEVKIKWTDKILRSKEINQQSIFDLLFSLDPRIVDFKSYKRKRLMHFICGSFSKNGLSFNIENMDNSFSKWLKTKK
jgi:hypothetical protein